MTQAEELTADEKERYEERAAILEFDARIPRVLAEHMAMREIKEARTVFSTNGGKQK